jgi:hypothetical protein
MSPRPEPPSRGVSAHSGNDRCRENRRNDSLLCLVRASVRSRLRGTLHDRVRRVRSSKLTARAGNEAPHGDRNGLTFPTSSAEQVLRRDDPMQLALQAAAALNVTRYSSNGGPPFFNSQKARGSYASPSAVLSGDQLGNFNATGYNGSGWPGSAGAKILMTAEENYSATANGTNIEFFTTADTTTTLAEKMRITGAGNVGIGTAIPAANGLTINSVTPTLTLELSGTSEESLYDDGSNFYVISTSGGNGVKLQHGSTLWTSSSIAAIIQARKAAIAIVKRNAAEVRAGRKKNRLMQRRHRRPGRGRNGGNNTPRSG